MGLKFLLNLAVIAIFTTCINYGALIETEVAGVTVLKAKIGKSGMIPGFYGGHEYYFVFAHHAKFKKTDKSLQLGFLEEFTMFQFRVESKNFPSKNKSADEVVLAILNGSSEDDKPKKMNVYTHDSISPLVATQNSDENQVEFLKKMEKEIVRHSLGEDYHIDFLLFNKYVKIENNHVLLHGSEQEKISGFRYIMNIRNTSTGEGDNTKTRFMITSLSMSPLVTEKNKNMSIFHSNHFVKIENNEWKAAIVDEEPSEIVKSTNNERIKDLLIKWGDHAKEDTMGIDISKPDSRIMFGPFFDELRTIRSTRVESSDLEMPILDMLCSSTNVEEQFKYTFKGADQIDTDVDFKVNFKAKFSDVPKTDVDLFIDESKPKTPAEQSESKSREVEHSISRSIEASIKHESEQMSRSRSVRKSIQDASSTSNSSSSSSSSKKKGGGGAIIAIIVVLLICLVGVVGFAFWKSKQLSGKARRNHNRKI